MAYRRRRRKTRKSQAWYNKKHSVKDIATQAYHTAKWLASVINVEKKKYDYDTSYTPDSSTGNVVLIPLIGQGLDDDDRTGNSIKSQSILHRGSFIWNSAGDSVQQLRYMIVVDNQQIGDTAPNVGNILTSGSYNGALNPDTLGRFKVLLDRRMSVYSSKPIIQFKDYLKYSGHVRYNGTTSNDVQKGGIYLVFISSQNGGNYPTVQSNIRYAYVDN